MSIMHRYKEIRQGFNLQVIFTAIFMLIYLLIWAYLAIFSRYMADEYCTANTLQTQGFFLGQLSIRNSYSGRYTFFFLELALQSIGVKSIAFTIISILLAWTTGLLWLARDFFLCSGRSRNILRSFLLAVMVIFACNASIKDYPQILYWQTGVLAYTLFNVFIVWIVNFIFFRVRQTDHETTFSLIGWSSLSFINGGLSETGSAVQITLFSILLLMTFFFEEFRKKQLRHIFGALLVGGIISLLVVGSAPGNLYRAGLGTPPPPVLVSLLRTFESALLFIPIWVKDHSLLAVICISVGAIIQIGTKQESLMASKRYILNLFISLFSLIVIIAASLAPSYIVRGFPPPERALVIPIFFVSIWFICAGWTLSILIETLALIPNIFIRLMSVVATVFVLIYGVAPKVVAGTQLIAPLSAYARMWDERHEYLTQMASQDHKTIVVEDFSKVEILRPLRNKLWTTGDFETFPNYWINTCAAYYYGVEAIIAE